MTRKVKMLVFEGLGDTLSSFDAWCSGRELDAVTHVPFSAQLFDAVRDLGDAELHLVAFHKNRGRATKGSITVEQVDNPFEGKAPPVAA